MAGSAPEHRHACLRKIDGRRRNEEEFEEDTKLTPDWRSIYKHATTNSAKRTVRDFFSSLLDEKFGEDPIHFIRSLKGSATKKDCQAHLKTNPLLCLCGAARKKSMST